MTKTEHYEPHGQSLLDYLHGEAQAVITVHSDGGQRTDVPVQLFFREPDHFPLELQAIELCRGRVLDIGAGAGWATLAVLQEKRVTRRRAARGGVAPGADCRR